MDRIHFGSKTRTMRLALALLTFPIFAVSQAPTSLQAPTTVQAPSTAQPVRTSATPAHMTVAAPAQKPASALLQPALDTVRTTLDGVRIDRWKKGSIRDEASSNIDSIRNDIRTNMTNLLQQADAAPGTISKLLPVSRHLDALYNVLLRVSEASRVSGPDDQAAALQKALQSLGNARLALGDRMQGSAEALEKQVADMRTTIQQQAQKAATPVPVALPCIPPPAKKTATKARKPAASTTPSNTTTPAKPAQQGKPQ